MASKPVFYGSIKTLTAQINVGDTTSAVSLYAGPANGGKIEAMAITSSDTASKDVALLITRNGTDYIIGTIPIAITAGQISATAPVDGLKASSFPWLRLDENGNPYMLIDSGSVLKGKVLTTVTSGKVIQFFLQMREV